MDQRASVRISEKGRLVIPAAMREQLGIQVGDVVDLRVDDNELRISTLKNRIERAQKRVKQYMRRGTSLSEELSAERRKAARHE